MITASSFLRGELQAARSSSISPPPPAHPNHAAHSTRIADDGSSSRTPLKSFNALRAAADAHAAAASSSNHRAHHHGSGYGHSMEEHAQSFEEHRVRRAAQRAAFLVHRAEEEQMRAEVYALNRLMRSREVKRFDAYVKARKLSRKRARAMRLAAEKAADEPDQLPLATAVGAGDLADEITAEVHACIDEGFGRWDSWRFEILHPLSDRGAREAGAVR